MNSKNEEDFCRLKATHTVNTPEGNVLYCDRHFAEYRLAVEQTFNHVEQWAKDGVGW